MNGVLVLHHAQIKKKSAIVGSVAEPELVRVFLDRIGGYCRIPENGFTAVYLDGTPIPVLETPEAIDDLIKQFYGMGDTKEDAPAVQTELENKEEQTQPKGEENE